MTEETTEVSIAVIKKDVSYIRDEVKEIKTLIVEKYVSMNEFLPVRNIVYGMVSLILISVVGAILTLIIK